MYIQALSRLETAFEFARKNIRVYPQTQSKRGYFKGFQDAATTDLKQIEEWSRQYRECNWAAMTGETSNLLVIDIDVKNGQNGEAELKKLTNDTNPETFTVRTGSGGRHFYFQYPQNVDDIGAINFTSIGHNGIEVKANRTWVTLPGAIYADGREYVIIKNVTPLPCPEWVTKLIAEYKSRKPERSDNTNGNNAETQEIETIPRGGRNNYLTSIAGKMRRRGFDKDIILAALKKENLRCDPPLPDTDIATIAASVASYPIPHYSFDDLGDAQKIIEYLGGDFRWCEITQCWFRYKNGVWKRDDEEMSFERATQDAVTQFIKDFELQGDKIAAKHWKAIIKNYTRLKRMYPIIKSHLTICYDFFNRHKNLLNCLNGTYDLENCAFYESIKTEYHSKQVNCEFVKDAQIPEMWTKFIDTIFEGDKELALYMQKLLGYSLCGNNSEQEFYILHGKGGNGKTQMMRVFGDIINDYCHMMGADKIMRSKYGNNEPYLAQLKDIRALFCYESDETKTLDSALINAMTGGEPITVAQKYERPQSFQISAKIFLVTNNKPTIKETTDGIWRRIRLIPFNWKVKDEERVVDFFEKLLASGRPGILNWLIEGYQLYRIEGLKPPQKVLVQSKEYRRDEDLIGQFLELHVQAQESSRIKFSQLHKRYNESLEGDGHVTKKRLGKELRNKGYVIEHSRDGEYIHGVCWIEDAPLIKDEDDSAIEALVKGGLC